MKWSVAYGKSPNSRKQATTHNPEALKKSNIEKNYLNCAINA